MKGLRGGWFGCMVLAIACDDPGSQPLSRFADTRSGEIEVVSAPLSGGTVEPSLVDLTTAQRNVLGAFVADGIVRCTGTLIAPQVALTAGHCFAREADPRRFAFVVAVDLAAAEPERLAVARVITHPTLDAALITLERAPARAFAPIVLQREAPDALVGTAIEVAGAGLGSEGVMRFGVFEVTALSPTRVEVRAEAPRGQCSGDSGGPWIAPGPRLVALSSTSAPDCGNPAFGVRVDVIAAWVETQLEGLDAEPTPEPGPEGVEEIEGVEEDGVDASAEVDAVTAPGAEELKAEAEVNDRSPGCASSSGASVWAALLFTTRRALRWARR